MRAGQPHHTESSCTMLLLSSISSVSMGVSLMQDGETITGTERTAALSKASELQLALTRDSLTQDIPSACQASTANAVKDR